MLPFHIKEILGLAAPAIGFVGDATYIRAILRGETKPHLFTWVVWEVIMIVIFLGQVEANAGPGAWLTGYNVLINILTITLAWPRSETTITRSDRIVLAASLAGIPVWLATKDPVWSVCLETGISAAMFYPTFRKSFHEPFSESIRSWILFTVSITIDLLAMDSYSLTTIIYPAYCVIWNAGFIAMVMYRRRIMEKTP